MSAASATATMTETAMSVTSDDSYNFEGVKEWMQLQDGESLLNMQKEITKLLEKHLKDKKKGSFPKGVSPPQLDRPRAWVTFTLDDAMKNGWEEFVLKDTKKIDGEKVEEYVTMPCSMMHEGAYFFDGSITESTPNGKQFNQKYAMALSKQRWSVKEKVGTHQEKYEEFLEAYDEEPVEKEKVVKVKITAEEKEMERKKKEVEKELLKAQEKEAKEEKKREEKEAKELLKAQEKAKKDEEKKKEAASKIVRADEVDDKLKKKVVKEKKEKEEKKVEKWSCEDDGKCHPWVFKGQKLFRNFNNGVYKKTPSGLPLWLGVYMEEEDKIDDSVEDPDASDLDE